MMLNISYIKTGYNAFFKPVHVFDFPAQINMEITTACNLRCNTCIHSITKLKSQQMSYNKFCYIVDVLKPRLLSIAGLGEPTLHKDLFKMASYVYNKHGTLVSITTNGTLLDKHAENMIESNIYLINVSLDGANPETYHKIRGNDFYEQILSGINKINCLKKVRNVNFPIFGGHFVIQRDNYSEMTDMISLAKSINMNNLMFLPLELHNKDDYLSLVGDMTKEKLFKEMERAYKYAEKKGINTNLSILLRDWDELWLKYTLDKPIPISKRPCVRPWISAYITLQGEVTPCCNLTLGAGKVVFGNIFEQDFKEIWNNNKAIAFRRMIRSGKKNIPVCNNCVPLTIWDKVKSFSNRDMLK